MSDAEQRTKGELSGAVSPMVHRRLAPWCEGCGVHHVHDALFRYATLQAGLTIGIESPNLFRFHPPTVAMPRLDPQASRAELVRRFLRAFGPATPVQLAAWLALTPAAARRWWEPVAPELLSVSVDGTTLHAYPSDLALLESPPNPPAARLLPPYDPLIELANRRFLLPDSAQRRQVWTPVANPGVLLLDGAIAGSWRQRGVGGRLTLTITPFRPLNAAQTGALETDARTMADYFGARHYDISFAA
ncbi:MAG: DNA glycosylase AlkZ-like family protein [Pseudonocardiaceae bacterium]